MNSTCIFCGRGPTTGEHLLPDWLRKHLGKDTLRLYRTGSVTRDKPPTMHEWKAPAATRKVPLLCESCNTTWGSNLEGLAKPVLLPMIQAYPKRLSRRSQEIAALWAVKTSMVHDRAGNESSWLVPHEHLKYVREHNVPPPEMFVWVAAYGGEKYVSSHVSFPFPYFDPRYRDQLPRGWGSTLCVGSLIMQMIHPYGADHRADEMMRETRDMNVCIWPSVNRRLAWPPKEVKDDDMLEAVSYPTGKAPS